MMLAATATSGLVAAEFVIALVFGGLGFWLSERFRRNWGRTPWGLPSLLWAFIFFLSLLIGVILFRIAQRNTRSTSTAVPGQSPPWYPPSIGGFSGTPGYPPSLGPSPLRQHPCPATAVSSRQRSGATGDKLLGTRCRGDRRAFGDGARSPRTATGCRTEVRLADGLRTAGAPARVREPGPRSSPAGRGGGLHDAFASRAAPRLARSGEACLARRPDAPSRAALLERRLVD